MSEFSESSRRPAGSANPPARRSLGGVLRIGCYLALAAAVATVAYSEMLSRQDRASADSRQERLVAQRGLTAAVEKRLSSEYTDSQGRLVADPPEDSQTLLNPDTLTLAHYVDAEVDVQPVDWPALEKHLAAATGKKVTIQQYWNSSDDVADVKTGKIQIVALHAADTPYLVNNAGFVPVAALGTEAGAVGNRLDITVAAGSPIKTLADVRGHKLICTRPDSITGYRAAIAVLAQDVGLRPDVDYTVLFSYGQKESALGVVARKYEVAALSDDKLQTLLKSGKIAPETYRVIHQSEVIPRVTFGYVYNLAPELAAKVIEATLAFSNASAPPDEASGKAMRFFPIDYKKDFGFVRKIDNSFDPRIRKRPKTEAATAEAPEDPAETEPAETPPAETGSSQAATTEPAPAANAETNTAEAEANAKPATPVP